MTFRSTAGLLHCAYKVMSSVTTVLASADVPVPSFSVFQPLKILSPFSNVVGNLPSVIAVLSTT